MSLGRKDIEKKRNSENREAKIELLNNISLIVSAIASLISMIVLVNILA